MKHDLVCMDVFYTWWEFEISVAQKHGEKSDATRSVTLGCFGTIASKECAKDKTCCRCHNEYLPVKLSQEIG